MIFRSVIMCLMLAAAMSSIAAEAIDGAAIYKQNCAACHGLNREGGVGVNLADKVWLKVKPEKDDLVKFINQGSVAAGMPAWQNVLDKEKIAAVAEFLLNPAATYLVAKDSASKADPYPELKKLILPAGFSISVYTDQVENARAMMVAPSGVVFVASRTT